MKYCQKCGKELSDESVVCINCGCSVAAQTETHSVQTPKTKYCQKCGKEILSDAVVCTYCGCSAKAAERSEQDEPNTLLCVLSFFIPLVGIIIWALKRKEIPNAAKKYLTISIISWVISFVVIFISSFIVGFVSVL